MATWPASIPASAWRQEDYTQAPPDITLRTQMDAGPAKVRLRFTAQVEPITGSFLLDSDQMADLIAFYKAQGGLSFPWVHPMTGVFATLRFVKPPSFKTVSGGMWQVAVQMEVMP